MFVVETEEAPSLPETLSTNSSRHLDLLTLDCIFTETDTVAATHLRRSVHFVVGSGVGMPSERATAAPFCGCYIAES